MDSLDRDRDGWIGIGWIVFFWDREDRFWDRFFGIVCFFLFNFVIKSALTVAIIFGNVIVVFTN